MDVREISADELDTIGAGRFTQISIGNLALGLQTAPTVNVGLISFFSVQAGAEQNQFVNAGNIA